MISKGNKLFRIIVLLGVIGIFIGLIFLEMYILSAFYFVIIYIGLFIFGNVFGRRYYEKKIVEFLENSEGERVKLTDVQEHFSKVSNKNSKELSTGLLTLLSSLEKKGIIKIENNLISLINKAAA